jgi:hypothetical protein
MDLPPHDYRQQWNLLDAMTKREVLRYSWRARRHADPQIRSLIVGFARERRSRWPWGVIYVVIWLVVFSMPVLLGHRAPVLAAELAAIAILGLSILGIIMWRLGAAIRANTD